MKGACPVRKGGWGDVPIVRWITRPAPTLHTFGRKLAALPLPKQHHVAQLWLYAWLLGQAGYPVPLTGRIVYMDMGSVCTVDVPMPDAEMQAAVETRLVEKVRLVLADDPAGPAGDPHEAWECNYCAFANLCPDRLVKARANASAAGATAA